jgi:hypothetical protein
LQFAGGIFFCGKVKKQKQNLTVGLGACLLKKCALLVVFLFVLLVLLAPLFNTRPKALPAQASE